MVCKLKLMCANNVKTPAEHVAQRIKMYRTRQHMTIDTLSRMLHVSPSTVSKYENCKLSIDVHTLFEIAAILNVSVQQLTDYSTPSKQEHTDSESPSFFTRSNILYFYQYFGLDKKIYACVMEIIKSPDDASYNVIIYYDVDDLSHYTDASYIYNGTMNCNELATHIYARNPYNRGDELTICAKTPFSTSTTTEGILVAVSTSLRNPYACKILFSLNPLPVDDELREKLSIYDKDTAKETKRVNALVVY